MKCSRWHQTDIASLGSTVTDLLGRTHRESPSALSPLHIAILCGSHPIVELLLDGKANPNAPLAALEWGSLLETC